MLRETWLLMVTALSPAGALQPGQMHSAIYVLGRTLSPAELLSDDFYVFERHEYGIFAMPVHLDAERLVESGMMTLRRDLWPAREYVITERGRTAAQRGMLELPADLIAYAERLVCWITSFSARGLLRVPLDEYEGPRARACDADAVGQSLE